MSDISIGLLTVFLLLLIILSAFFSSSETSMMSLNRYRLRHLVKQKHQGAIRADKLLTQPDRLIGVILIGNNFVNILASAIATVIALKVWGDAGIAVATTALTLIILIFAEVTPKTVAVLKPEKIAFPATLILQPLLKLLYPLVWSINSICNNLLKRCGFNVTSRQHDHLSTEELKTIVHETGVRIPQSSQNMLLSILDLEKVTVQDIMIPRNEIIGIDINDDLEDILDYLRHSEHSYLPVYKDDINKVKGILYLRNMTRLLTYKEVTKNIILQETHKPYFIPQSTRLHNQLLNFQKKSYHFGLVVDEYGYIQGMITLEDILEEIVGKFIFNEQVEHENISLQQDGSFFVDGSTAIREINKTLQWSLPVDGPKTLNGLITETLEAIPENNVCLKIDKYHLETLEVKDNFIKTIRLSIHPADKDEEE